MFTAELLIIATWNQPKRPLTEDWIKTWYMCTHTHMHTHTMECYSAIYKNEIVPLAATWMDLEIVIPSEETQRNIVWYGSYMESKKK